MQSIGLFVQHFLKRSLPKVKNTFVLSRLFSFYFRPPLTAEARSSHLTHTQLFTISYARNTARLYLWKLLVTSSTERLISTD